MNEAAGHRVELQNCSPIVKEEPLEGSIRTEAQPEVVLQGAPQLQFQVPGAEVALCLWGRLQESILAAGANN